MGSDRRQFSEGARARVAWALLLIALGVAPNSTESAIANGDTRTLSLTNQHTNESGTFTYMVNGAYDKATLEKLNWFLRDWRLNESTQMDPKLFDILWEVYRESGSQEPVDVLSAYRSPQTNAMLRHRSRQVARYSQHMEGKAIDAHFIDVSTATIRDIAMRMQAGGVGFYPSGLTPWVHVDSGGVRYWPVMNREALTRLFPDGKTVFIPRDGQPMPGYEVAKAEIESRGGAVPMTNSGESAVARGDDSEDSGEATVSMATGRGRSGAASFLASPTVAEAKQNLPSGETYAAAASTPQETSSYAEAQEPVTLRGSVAAQFIAPLPPRKPPEFLTLALADAPEPPRRPTEFALAAAASKPAVVPGGERDLILALLKHGRAPSVITRGVEDRPNDALALTETVEAPLRPQDMIAAAALAAPLPPLRPALRLNDAGESSSQISNVARAASAQLRPGFDPFGAIAVQAFETAPSPLAEALKQRALAASN